MGWIRSTTGRRLLLLAAAMALPLAGALTLMQTGHQLGPVLRQVMMLVPLIPALWLADRYWRSLDEVAREAQKTAFFWGGSLGMVGGVLLLVLPLRLDTLMPVQTPRALMLYGGAVAALSSVTGFLVAWAWWWWARRR